MAVKEFLYKYITKKKQIRDLKISYGIGGGGQRRGGIGGGGGATVMDVIAFAAVIPIIIFK